MTTKGLKTEKFFTGTSAALALAVFMSFGSAFAEESTMEKVETKANQASDSVKKNYRAAKDEVCEMVNGERKCIQQKVKHKLQNAKDAVGTKAKEIENKVD